ncbi:MAG: septum formation initiator family protein [Firmicutes bacterium]|nr:septum formation initiator family protein [Bacillota bacterium]
MKKRTRNKPKSKAHMYFYIPFWMFMIVVFAGFIITQLALHETYVAELESLQAELQIEQQIAQDLQYRQIFYQSDAYIEQLAREMLGFIREDEIIFRVID